MARQVGAVRERPVSTLAVVLAVAAMAGAAQEPVNDRPNPYTTVEHYFKMPAGRTWGATSAVEVSMTGSSPSRGASSGTAVGASSADAGSITGSPTTGVSGSGVGSVNSSCGTAGVWSALSG